MTTICVGAALERVLRKLEEEPSRYAQVVFCSPFIDSRMIPRLIRFAIEARKCGCGVRLITSDAHRQLLQRWPRREHLGIRAIVNVVRLHAKVYLAIGRLRTDSWAVVTSANLTESGLRKNVEIGVLICATSPQGAQLVEHIRWFLERLASVMKET